MSENDVSGFFFFCEYTECKVDRRDCEDCIEVEKCKNTGRLKDIDEKYGFNLSFNTEKKNLLKLSKKVQRALKGSLPDSLKKEYMARICGSVSFKPLFDAKNFKEIVQKIGLRNGEDALFKASLFYLTKREIWRRNLSSGEVLEKINKLVDTSNNLLEQIQQSYSEIYTFLKPECDLDKLQLSLIEFLQVVNDVPSKGKRLRDYPFILYIRELAIVYSNSTNLRPTSSYNSDTGQCSPFLQLTYECLKIIDPESLRFQM